MNIEVTTQPAMDGKHLAIARQINLKVKSQSGTTGEFFVMREAACIRPTKEAAEAVAVLDLVLAGLPESI